jgi:hypothetical protein
MGQRSVLDLLEEIGAIRGHSLGYSPKGRLTFPSLSLPLPDPNTPFFSVEPAGNADIAETATLVS